MLDTKTLKEETIKKCRFYEAWLNITVYGHAPKGTTCDIKELRVNDVEGDEYIFCEVTLTYNKRKHHFNYYAGPDAVTLVERLGGRKGEVAVGDTLGKVFEMEFNQPSADDSGKLEEFLENLADYAPKKPKAKKAKTVTFASVCDDAFSDICPSCNTSFSSQFGQCVCSHCGFISAGCDACPGESNSHIDCSKCPVSIPISLYGIFTQKEFNSLPIEYRGSVYHKANHWFSILINNRVYHIYSERKVIGVTTIDMEEWRKGNHALSKTPTIEDILA